MGNPLYSPETFLEECLDYQAVIDDMRDPAARDEVARELCGVLFGRASHYGARKVFVRSEVAFVSSVNGPVRQEQAGTPGLQFGEIVAKGRLGNPEYTRFNREGVLAWTLYDAHVKAAEELDFEESMDMLDDDPTLMADRMPTHRALRIPIHIPVRFINMVLCASDREPYQPSQRVMENALLMEPTLHSTELI